MRAQQHRIDKGMYWDRAWSLVEGCSPVSEGCDNCWSAAQTHIRQFQGNEKIASRYRGLLDENKKFNGQIRFMSDNLSKPRKVKKPQIWAVWNDLFHETVSRFATTITIHQMNTYGKHHTYLICTKRPKNAYEFFTSIGRGYKPWPLPNIWIGTTVESQKNIKRLDYLVEIPASVRYVSVEPMLGPVDLKPYLDKLHWVIIGCESGSNRRKIDDIHLVKLLHDCLRAGVPVFLKQWEIKGKVVKLPEFFGKWDHFPKEDK